MRPRGSCGNVFVSPRRFGCRTCLRPDLILLEKATGTHAAFGRTTQLRHQLKPCRLTDGAVEKRSSSDVLSDNALSKHLDFINFNRSKNKNAKPFMLKAPKIRWDEVDANLTVKIHDYAKLEVDLAFEAEFGTSAALGKSRAAEAADLDWTRFLKPSSSTKPNGLRYWRKSWPAKWMNWQRSAVFWLVRPKAKDGLTSG